MIGVEDVAVVARRDGGRPGARTARPTGVSWLVSLVVAVVSVTAFGAGAAGACSITGEPPDYTTLANEADAVFVGTATSVELRTSTEGFRSTARLWTVTVDEVIKGDVAQTQIVVSWDMASCGTAIREPGRYVIYAREMHKVGSVQSSEPMLVADVFGGTHLAAGAPIVPAEAGPRHAPHAGTAGYPDGRSFSRSLVVGGLAVVGIAIATVAGAWLVRRRRRAGQVVRAVGD